METNATRAARFRLTVDQLAAALAVAGITPTPRSTLPELVPVERPAQVLKENAALSDGKGLRGDVDAALRVVADPSQALVVLANRAGELPWAMATFLRGPGDGPVVMQAGGDGELDLAVVPTVTQATVLVDELLDLTTFATRDGSTPVDLDVPGFAALLAAADAVQQDRLEGWLSRQPERPRPDLSAHVLEHQLAKGMDGIDTRWAVTAGRVASPAGLGGARGRMADGLATLSSRQLAKASPTGVTLTAEGERVVRSFGQLITTGSLSVALTGPANERAAIAHVTVFRTPDVVWMVSWTGLGGDEPGVSLFPASAETAVLVVRSLLEPPTPSPEAEPAPPRKAPARKLAKKVAAPAKRVEAPAKQAEAPAKQVEAPAKQAAAKQAVAKKVGGKKAPATTAPAEAAPAKATPAKARPATRVEAAAKGADGAEAASPEPAETAPTTEMPRWQRTHVVAREIHAWEAPDPTATPMATLAAGVELQVMETAGAWARAVASNGWSGWVDGRYLQESPE